MSNSIGLIESKGLVALVEAADVISKNSPVEILGVHKLVNGLVTLAVCGNTDYVCAAIESGTEAGKRVGEIYSFSVVDNPTNKLLEIFSELFPSDTNFYHLAEEKFETKKNVEDKKSVEGPAENISEAAKTKTESKREKSKPLIASETVPVQKAKRKKITLETETSKPENQSLSKSEVENKIEKNITNPEKQTEKTLDGNESSKKLSTIERLRLEALGLKDKKIKSKEVSSTENVVKEKVKRVVKPKGNKEIDEIDFEAINGMNVHKLRHYAREFSEFPIKGREISRANRNELVELFSKLKH